MHVLSTQLAFILSQDQTLMIAFNLQITNWIFYYIPSFERSKILLTVFLRCKDNCTIKIFFSFFFFFLTSP